MREPKTKIITPVCLLALMSLSQAAFATPGGEMNQRDTQIYNRQVNDKGSDDSLRNSTVYAMQALMDLSATRLPAAISNGYRAYGKFRNSENLDKLKDQNAINANSLSSVDSATAALPTKTITSFRRIDGGFLREGEAGKVAAEFERQTGMSRDTFLTQMAEVSEKKIKRTDPQMIDKALSRFEGFIEKIPNQEFRKNVEKNIALVPSSMRRGMIATAVTKLAGFFADAGHQTLPDFNGSSLTDAGKVASANEKGGAASAGGALGGLADGQNLAAGADAGDTSRTPASPGGTAELAAAEGGGPAGAGKNELSNIVAGAIATQKQDSVMGASQLAQSQEPTIFQQVTNRYRLLTPSLVKP